MCFCYLQDVGGIVKARLNVVTVYLLTMFMVFTCFNSHHYVCVNDCLCYKLLPFECKGILAVYRDYISLTEGAS